jgi:tetratricopeptide (TPR) repeat protein
LEFEAVQNILRGLRFRLLVRAVLTVSLIVSANAGLIGQGGSSPSDSDGLFVHAVQEYTQNRLSSARSEFEKIQGARAQEAKQYVAKIDAYLEDMNIAATIMRRSSDELDASSLEYAIQKYQDALRIKPDGPGHPAQELDKATALHNQLVKQGSKAAEARERDLCTKAVGAAQEHHYREAELLSCALANDNPAYSCGGDEAVHMCQQMRDLARFGGPPVENQTATHSGAGTGAGTSAIDRGQAAYEKNDFPRARTLFARAPAELKPSADEYLDKISRYQGFMAQAENLSKTSAYEEARIAFTNAANIKPDGPGNPRAQALLMELEQGIDQFYSGDYVSATRSLEGYVRESTEREPLAHFYLGASKLARFFLAGSEDASLQQEAMNDLKMAKQAGFKAKGQDVSPRILQAYNDLAF